MEGMPNEGDGGGTPTLLLRRERTDWVLTGPGQVSQDSKMPPPLSSLPPKVPAAPNHFPGLRLHLRKHT